MLRKSARAKVATNSDPVEKPTKAVAVRKAAARAGSNNPTKAVAVRKAAARAGSNNPTKRQRPASEEELDLVTSDLYSSLQEEVMMELMAELKEELTPMYNQHMTEVYTAQARAASTNFEPVPVDNLLWDVVATPQMMQAFAATVVPQQQAVAV